MGKTFFAVFLCVLLGGLFFFSQKTFAATSVSVSGTPPILDYQTEFSASVNLNCSGCSDSYIRGVFYPSGTSYFGYTQDNLSNWNNSPASLCTSYFKVAQSDLLSGTWSGTLKFKPDKDSPYYDGPGEYLFKVGRYTSSCGSPTWSSEITIAITGPSPTPSPSADNNSSSSTSQPSPTPTPKPSASAIQVASKSASVAGEAKLPSLLPAAKSPTAAPSQGVLGYEGDRLPIYVVVGGIIMLFIGLVIVFKEKIRSTIHF